MRFTAAHDRARCVVFQNIVLGRVTAVSPILLSANIKQTLRPKVSFLKLPVSGGLVSENKLIMEKAFSTADVCDIYFNKFQMIYR